MNTEKLEKLKKSLDNKFIPDNMKDKIRAEIKKLEADIKTDETITATEVKEEVKEIEKKVEKALEVAEEKEEQAEAKAEEKKEKAPRKAREKKPTESETKTPKVEPKSTAKKKSVFSIAKEIRKDNESWEDAKERARKMMKSETTETKKKTRTETDKLLAMVRRNKEYKKLAGTSNLPKDASRRALPRGKRVSADGNVYYENRANRVDVGGFKNAYLAKGGEIESGEIWNLLHKEEKLNFLTNKKNEIEKKIKLNQDIIFKSIKNDSWDSLNENIKNVFNEHIKNKKFYFENIGKKVTWEDFKGKKRKGIIDNIDFNGNYIIIEPDELYGGDTLSPDEVNIQNESKKKFLLFAEGGTIIGTPETPLGRDLGIDYTGLVGETGGMSAGEMFAEGGSIENQYEGKTPSQIWSMLSVSQKYHFLEDHSKEIESTPMSIEKATKTAYKFLPTKIKKSFEHHVKMGQYAMGGSLGNHGLKQGDQIIKTMSGGVQKVKTKSGDIVYVNLANGYRGVTPPLPFAKGGYTNERRHVNKAQDYEVRYAKNKPNRTGYLGKRSFDDGGQLEMKFLKGGKLESKIQKKVDEVNSLIEKAIDKDGDPIMVVDKSGTWEEPMQYKPIVYKNGRLYFEYYEPYSGKTQKEVVNKSNIEFDGYPMLLDIAKMYRSALKRKGVSFSGGGQIKVGDDVKIIKPFPNADMTGKKGKVVELTKNNTGVIYISVDGKRMAVLSEYITKFEGGGKTTNNEPREGDLITNIGTYGSRITKVADSYVEFYDNRAMKTVVCKKSDLVLNNLDDDGDDDGYYEDEPNSWICKKSYEGGGKTTFKEKATAIAKNFEGKKVEPKYQKEYGKTYDKAEAKEVGNKIAGSQKAKYDSKMSGGGSTKRGGAMQLAKQIRKDGESWQSALKRANEQMRNK